MIRRDSAAYIGDPRRGLRQVGLSRRKALTAAAVWLHDRDDRFAWAAVAVSMVLFFYAVAYAFPHGRGPVDDQGAAVFRPSVHQLMPCLPESPRSQERVSMDTTLELAAWRCRLRRCAAIAS